MMTSQAVWHVPAASPFAAWQGPRMARRAANAQITNLNHAQQNQIDLFHGNTPMQIVFWDWPQSDARSALQRLHDQRHAGRKAYV